jgi:hypothetical protein
MENTASADTHKKSIYMENWTAERIRDQGGRLAIVTGANSGLGEVTARRARAGGRGRARPPCRVRSSSSKT